MPLRVHVVVVEVGLLLLVVQVLVQRAGVVVGHRLQVGVQLVHVVAAVRVAALVVVVLAVLARVVVLAGEVAVVVLVVARVAEAVAAGLDEAQPDAEDDVQAGRELHLVEQLLLLQHLEVAGQGQQAVGAGLVLRADAVALHNSTSTPIS